MEYFTQIFGNYNISWAVALIAATVFLIGCYKKIEKFFSERAIIEKNNEERIQKIIKQTEQYQKWQEQNIATQEKTNELIHNINSKLDTINNDLSGVKTSIQESKASTCRYRILRFDDEVMHGQKHSKEHFDQILDDITDYEKYCANHPDYKNNKAVMSIENIKEKYHTCTQEGTFI